MIEHVTQNFIDAIKLPNPNTRQLNYLLVMPRIATRNDMTYQLPYGLCMVSAALKASGRSVYTLNLNYKEHPYELLRETILKNSIDVVATGGLSGQFSQLKQITDTAKSTKPDIITMVGGGIITAEPAVAMEAIDTVDYGMIGEGEITINALAYAIENKEDARKVEGVVLRDGTIAPHRAEIADLNILPFPDYEGFEYELCFRENMSISASDVNTKTAIIATGRSCPFNCTFCFHSSGKKYRRRSVDNIFQEIDWVMRHYDVNYIMFIDELFAANREFVKAITDGLKQRKIRYWVQTRVDVVSKEILQMLKDSGCYEITYGVESADDHILKSMQKGITVKQVERAFDLSNEVGLHAKGYIIFGDVEESKETIQNSICWWKNHPDYDIRMWWILTFPGSHLYQVALERGLITDEVNYLRENNTQLNLSKMTDECYWDMVKKVELFQTLVSSGVDVELEDIDSAAEIIGERLKGLLKEHKIAVWPATFDIIRMLNHVSSEFVKSNRVCFVNSNPNGSFVLGSKDLNKPIYTPDDVFSKYDDIDIVFYAFGHRSSERVFREISSMIKRQYHSVRQLIKISELVGRV